MQKFSNELIENVVMEELSIPSSRKLIAQMPYGKPTAEPDEKDYELLSDRVLIFK